MSSYRPICDTWLLAPPKMKYYGAYPSGFLMRARDLLGVHIDDPVLHVCGGMVRKYPFRGFGPSDSTLDLDPACEPDFLQDAREPFPLYPRLHSVDWAAVLIDRPYTEEDADHYLPGRERLPSANALVSNAFEVLPEGARVGILDFVQPQTPKGYKPDVVALISVRVGTNTRQRVYTVMRKATK
jgi:hypothetical protein